MDMIYIVVTRITWLLYGVALKLKMLLKGYKHPLDTINFWDDVNYVG